VLGLLAFNIWRANSGAPAPPSPSELAPVDLALPKSAPPSRALAEFFRPRAAYEKRGEVRRIVDRLGKKQLAATLDSSVELSQPPSYDPARHLDGHVSFPDGRWLKSPDKVLASLGELKPPLAAFRAALHAPGCIPLPNYTSRKDLFSFPYFMSAVHLDLVESLALAQRGDHRRAAEQINRLADRLLQLEQECTVDLIALLILDACLIRVHRSWSYLLSLPAAQEQHADIWERMIRLETRSTRTAVAWRREAATGAERIKAAGEETSSIWLDVDETLRVFRLFMKRRVWLAEAGLHSDVWTKEFAEDRYLAQLESLSGLDWLRWNRDGLRMLSAMSPRGDHKYVVKLHQDRCALTAKRALWIQEMARRGQPLPAKVSTHPPKNPFTREPFGEINPRRPVCQAPERYRFSDKVFVGSLPVYPITAKNSGPSRRR
jgi:hypothetical protein